MKVYGYVRLSRDEDNRTKESLQVQKRLIKTYSEENDLNLIEIVEDDNISGYTFNRPGLEKLKELIEDEKVNILVAKDLSRIGRHNAKTLLFLDYLEEYGVRLILTDDDYDSEKDDDDIIGIKTWYNERYVKDISKKIRANIRQKQKEEGLVIIPPYGYEKDDNKCIEIDEESALVVKEIFNLYLQGYGLKKIARVLNDKGYKTPMTRKQEIYGGFGNQNYKTSHLWYHTTINRMLKNEAYIGTLICRKTKRDKVKGKKKFTTEDEQFIHEDFFPPIISKQDFDNVQKVMKSRVINNVRSKNKRIYNYAGLVECLDCGNSFVVKTYETKTKGLRKKYICATYHKFGTNHCKSHKIMEEKLDQIVYDELFNIKQNAESLLKKIDKEIKIRRKSLNSYNKTLEKVKESIFNKKEEIKNYAKQLAKGLIDEEIFKELTSEAKNQLDIYEEQLNSIRELMKENPKLKQEVIKSIEVLDEMIENRKLNNSQLSLLVEKIKVKENLNGKLDIFINWKIPGVDNKVLSS